MHYLILSKVIQFFKQILLPLIIICLSLTVNAQNGTYEKKASKGAYGIISVRTKANQVTAEIFTWWNTPSGQTGGYLGKGIFKNTMVTLSSEENDPDCKVTLSAVQDKLKAQFDNCNTDHLNEDFNGVYTKITDAVAGDYVIQVSKAYFHKTPDAASRLKTYVLKGDKVRLDIDRIGASKQNWLYVYFTNKAGKETAGFIALSDLKRVDD